MASIFINFRNRDGDWTAQALRDTLAGRFGAEEVFLSSASIPPATYFDDEMLRQAGNCQVLLALIGPQWLTVTDPDGRPKLGAPSDWVSREIATALTAGRRVIPVLLDGASHPQASELPPQIAALARLQGRRLDRPRYAADAEALVRDLKALIPDLHEKHPGPAERRGADVRVTVGRSDGQVAGVSMPDGGHFDGRVDVKVDQAGHDSRIVGMEKLGGQKKVPAELLAHPVSGPLPGGGGTGSPPP
ncbi:MAG: toll/interleukin-1 receptor domain-containing protein [Streptosporangiaceae bacterium]